jgi:hypothetical protein
MDEPLPALDSPSEAPPPSAISLAARLLNVFAIPGEVFAGVKASRVYIGNWLVPALLLTLVGVLSAVVVVSQPGFQRQMHELTQRYGKAVDQQVKAGKVKQADADLGTAVLRAATTPVALKSLWAIAGALAGAARVFWWGLILWLLSRLVFKVRVTYPKALEVAGLALMVNLLGTVVILLLVVNLPQLFAMPDAGLAVSDFDTGQESLLLVGVATAFLLWLLGLLAIGLSKLAGVPFPRAAWFVFAAWVLPQSLLYLGAGVLMQFAR